MVSKLLSFLAYVYPKVGLVHGFETTSTWKVANPNGFPVLLGGLELRFFP